MSEKITPKEFIDMAKALYNSKDATQEDIDRLIETTLVSLNFNYLNGLKILWKKAGEIEGEHWGGDGVMNEDFIRNFWLS